MVLKFSKVLYFQNFPKRFNVVTTLLYQITSDMGRTLLDYNNYCDLFARVGNCLKQKCPLENHPTTTDNTRVKNMNGNILLSHTGATSIDL